jgi:hypothetical protein
MHLPRFVDCPRGWRFTTRPRLSEQRTALTSPLRADSESDRGPRGGNGHTPSTTTNTPFWPAAARAHVVRDPPPIETCASAPRLCLEQGIHPRLKPFRKHVESSHRRFGPARSLGDTRYSGSLPASEPHDSTLALELPLARADDTHRSCFCGVIIAEWRLVVLQAWPLLWHCSGLSVTQPAWPSCTGSRPVRPEWST